jgi:hypothetical protein
LFSVCDFKNIILSRKGFDSASGYGYSPFDPETGRYIVMPIPGSKSEQILANKTRYEDLRIKQNYLPGIMASNLREIVFAKEIGYSRKTRDEITINFAHFDPWLGHCPWLDDGADHHIGAFGQVNAAQGHLEKNSVGVGSLFLFFSRFVPIKGRENQIGIPLDYKKGAYFLYGWLKVGKVAKSMSDIQDEQLRLRHPHATDAYFAKYKNNAIYLSDKLLSNDSAINGCGYFPRLCKELLLSSVQHPQTPCVWQLPAFFHQPENRPTYLQKASRWILQEDSVSCLVTVPARGQEFVFRNSPDFVAWLSGIIERVNCRGAGHD